MTDTERYKAPANEVEELAADMDDPTLIEQDDLDELESKAAEADELSDRLDDVNATLDELADYQETLDEVSEEKLDELRQTDEAVVLAESEYEELTDLVDEVGQVFAEELAEYSPFSADELQDNFSPTELKAKVDEHEEASIESELAGSGDDPEPEGGSADPEELSGSSEDYSDADTEEELRDKIAESLEADGMTRQARKVREGEIGLDDLGLDGVLD